MHFHDDIESVIRHHVEHLVEGEASYRGPGELVVLAGSAVKSRVILTVVDDVVKLAVFTRERYSRVKPATLRK